jgi:hypothetical protein
MYIIPQTPECQNRLLCESISVAPPPFLLDNGSVNMFLRQGKLLTHRFLGGPCRIEGK